MHRERDSHSVRGLRDLGLPLEPGRHIGGVGADRVQGLDQLPLGLIRVQLVLDVDQDPQTYRDTAKLLVG